MRGAEGEIKQQWNHSTRDFSTLEDWDNSFNQIGTFSITGRNDKIIY